MANLDAPSWESRYKPPEQSGKVPSQLMQGISQALEVINKTGLGQVIAGGLTSNPYSQLALAQSSEKARDASAAEEAALQKAYQEKQLAEEKMRSDEYIARMIMEGQDVREANKLTQQEAMAETADEEEKKTKAEDYIRTLSMKGRLFPDQAERIRQGATAQPSFWRWLPFMSSYSVPGVSASTEGER